MLQLFFFLKTSFRRRGIFIACFFLLFYAPDLLGQSFNVPDKNYEKSLNSFLKVYYDSGSGLTINKIRSADMQRLFHNNTYTVPFWGKMNGNMWARLILKNTDSINKIIYVQIKYKSTYSYQFHHNNLFLDSTGNAISANTSSSPDFRGIVLNSYANSTDTVYFRINGSYKLRYNPGVGSIQASCTDSYSYSKSFKKNTLFYGFYLGFIFIVVLYTLIVFFTYKEPAFFWFIAYLTGMALLVIANYDIGIIYFWPGLSDDNLSFYIYTMSNIITPISIVYFVRFFFKPHLHFPLLNRVFLIFPVLDILFNVVNVFLHPYFSFSYYISFIVILLVLAYYLLVLLLSFKKVPFASLMVLSFTCLVVGIIITNLIYAKVFQTNISNAKFIHISGILLSCIGMIYTIFRYLVNQRKEKENILAHANEQLEIKVVERTKQLAQEKKKSDMLLSNILPEEIATELKENGRSKAKLYNGVTVFFSDFINFTGISEKMSPEELVNELDHCFRNFDLIMEKYNMEKIKTIGDAYMAACGLPLENADHAKIVVNASKEIRSFMAKYKSERLSENRVYFDMRIGIHSGSVVAGIVGVKKFAYDIWGDTVNTAARMEQNSVAGEINVSGATYELIKNDFAFEYRGKIAAKNKGEIDMYFVK